MWLRVTITLKNKTREKQPKRKERKTLFGFNMHKRKANKCILTISEKWRKSNLGILQAKDHFSNVLFNQ